MGLFPTIPLSRMRVNILYAALAADPLCFASQRRRAGLFNASLTVAGPLRSQCLMRFAGTVNETKAQKISSTCACLVGLGAVSCEHGQSAGAGWYAALRGARAKQMLVMQASADVAESCWIRLNDCILGFSYACKGLGFQHQVLQLTCKQVFLDETASRQFLRPTSMQCLCKVRLQ